MLFGYLRQVKGWASVYAIYDKNLNKSKKIKIIQKLKKKEGKKVEKNISKNQNCFSNVKISKIRKV